MGGSFRWEAMCLADDPFAGDFGEGETPLFDRMVTNRGGGICHTCAGECAPGTRNRVKVDRVDGALETYRWCQLCCFAMAIYGLGRDGLADRQQRIGDERRATTSPHPGNQKHGE